MICDINFMGFEFLCEVDYKVTSRGTRPVYSRDPNEYDPGSPPEWITKSIKLYRYERTIGPGVDGPHTIRLVPCPEFEATGKLFSVLANCDAVTESIEMEINEASDKIDECYSYGHAWQ